jgi:hypothetical protein
MKQHAQHIRNLAMKQLGTNALPSGPAESRRCALDDAPPKPVIGRRDSPKKIGREIDLNENLRKPLSPSNSERHLILRADKVCWSLSTKTTLVNVSYFEYRKR